MKAAAEPARRAATASFMLDIGIERVNWRLKSEEGDRSIRGQGLMDIFKKRSLETYKPYVVWYERSSKLNCGPTSDNKLIDVN